MTRPVNNFRLCALIIELSNEKTLFKGVLLKGTAKLLCFWELNKFFLQFA
jgi:hypothetical protein